MQNAGIFINYETRDEQFYNKFGIKAAIYFYKDKIAFLSK